MQISMSVLQPTAPDFVRRWVLVRTVVAATLGLCCTQMVAHVLVSRTKHSIPVISFIASRILSCGFSLSDVNECRSGSNDCEELCVNTEGSYECDCSVGYALATDGLNCIGENDRMTLSSAHRDAYDMSDVFRCERVSDWR